jgi:hypothetical protein
MKNALMITASVAALLAAGGLAFAQGANEHREQPAMAAPEQKAPEGKTDRQKLDTPQKSQSMKPAETAQKPEGKIDPKVNAPQKTEQVMPAPGGQPPRKSPGANSGTVGQGGSTQPAPHDAPGERMAPKAAAPAESSRPGAAAELSTEHRAQMRETIRGEKVAPLTDVHFSVTIGEAVPRTVHLNVLSPRIIEFAPQYRGYSYILVGDDILIVDPRTLRIMAVIAA